MSKDFKPNGISDAMWAASEACFPKVAKDTWNATSEDIKKYRDDMESFARLRDAAPELLEMLKEWLQAGVIDPRDDDRAKRSFALIAKIEGKTPTKAGG